MIVMVMAVDHILDRLIGHLPNLVDQRLGWPQIRDRIADDHTLRRHDEDRLMAPITDHVDVVSAVDLFGCDLWRTTLRTSLASQCNQRRHSWPQREAKH